MDLKKMLEDYKKQQEQVKEIFIKIQGKIEMCEELLKEKKDNKKQFFEIEVNMPNKDKGVVRRAIVTPDKHFPLADIPAIKCLKKTIEIVKPDIYIDLGDVGEWSAFSHWKWKRKKAPPLEFLIEDFDQDVKDVNKGMDMIDESQIKLTVKKDILQKAIMMTGVTWQQKNILTYRNTNLQMRLNLKNEDINTISLVKS